MAKIYEHPDDVPEHKGPIPPGLKPPVHESPYQDPEDDPEDLNKFLVILREIKGMDRVRKDPFE